MRFMYVFVIPDGFQTVRPRTLFRILDVPGSNLVPDTGYPDLGFSCFSSVPPDKCRNNALN